MSLKNFKDVFLQIYNSTFGRKEIKPVEEQPLTNLSPESWPFPTSRPEEASVKTESVVNKKPKKPTKTSYKKPAKIASKK